MERDDTWVMMDMLPGGLETEDDFVMIDPGNLQPPPPTTSLLFHPPFTDPCSIYSLLS